MSGRIDRIEKAVQKVKSSVCRSGVDAFLFNDRDSIRYLTGFYLEGVMLLILPKSQPIYFVDSMNGTLAQSIFSGSKLHLVTASKSKLTALADYVRDMRIKKIVVNREFLTLELFDRLSKLLPKRSLMPKSGKGSPAVIVEEMRKIKDPEEIRILRAAAKETVRIWRNVRKMVKTGMSEMDIARLIDMKILARGYSNSFPTISAVGKNTAYPHAVPTAKRLRRGEHLLLDFGIDLGGYSSDLTRVYLNGRINRQVKDFLKLVQKLHDIAIEEISPGVKISSICSKISNTINSNNMQNFVLHGLGHGIGLNVHEKPFLRVGVDECFRAGMVVTIEPGLYKTNLGGIRIEDMILVTENGCEILTKE